MSDICPSIRQVFADGVTLIIMIHVKQVQQLILHRRKCSAEAQPMQY